MKTKIFFKQIPGLMLVGGALMFISCENNNRSERGTLGAGDQTTTVTTDDASADRIEMTDADYISRRERVSNNVNYEIQRVRAELDELRVRSANAAEGDQTLARDQIERLEARVENLEEQQNKIDEATRDNWEETERSVETTLQDRDGNLQDNSRQNNQTDTDETGTGTATGVGTGVGTETDRRTETGTDIRREADSNTEERTDAPANEGGGTRTMEDGGAERDVHDARERNRE